MNQLPAHVDVMEVSPRDGLQNEDVLLSTEDKLRLIDFALAANCKRIEVTSFVHPQRVPAMADAEAVCQGLPQRGDVRYTGLILNQRGYERLRATERIDEAGLVVPATDTFGERNQGQSLDQAIEMARAVITHGRSNSFPVQVTVAVAFGCPFEGLWNKERLLDTVLRLADAGPVEIALADTIGVAVPPQVYEAFVMLREHLGDDIPLRVHLHDTRNTGIANAYAALQAGVQTLDASIGGIGGCPFAPNASGNVATEDLVYMLNHAGVEHDVTLPELLEGAAWLETKLHKTVPSMLLKAGDFPVPPAQ